MSIFGNSISRTLRLVGVGVICLTSSMVSAAVNGSWSFNPTIPEVGQNYTATFNVNVTAGATLVGMDMYRNDTTWLASTDDEGSISAVQNESNGTNSVEYTVDVMYIPQGGNFVITQTFYGEVSIQQNEPISIFWRSDLMQAQAAVGEVYHIRAEAKSSSGDLEAVHIYEWSDTFGERPFSFEANSVPSNEGGDPANDASRHMMADNDVWEPPSQIGTRYYKAKVKDSSTGLWIEHDEIWEIEIVGPNAPAYDVSEFNYSNVYINQMADVSFGFTDPDNDLKLVSSMVTGTNSSYETADHPGVPALDHTIFNHLNPGPYIVHQTFWTFADDWSGNTTWLYNGIALETQNRAVDIPTLTGTGTTMTTQDSIVLGGYITDDDDNEKWGFLYARFRVNESSSWGSWVLLEDYEFINGNGGSSISYTWSPENEGIYQIMVRGDDPYSNAQSDTSSDTVNIIIVDNSTLEDPDPPAQITGLVMSEEDLSSIRLSWTEPIPDEMSDIQHYELFFEETGGSLTSNPLIIPKNYTSFVKTNLYHSTSYSARMRAVDLWDKPSAQYSATVTGFTLNPFLAPQSLSISPLVNGEITLTWLPLLDNRDVQGYEIYINGTIITVGDVLTYVLTGLSPTQDHSIRVRAINITGTKSAWTSAAFVEAQNGLTLTANPQVTTAPGSSTLTWTSENADSLTLVGDGLSGLPDPLPASGSFQVTGLAAGYYNYTLTATIGSETKIRKVRVTVKHPGGWGDLGPPPSGDSIVGTLAGDLSVDNKGAANYSVALPIPSGRAGLEPSLAVTYNSQSGNGLMGVGFSLSAGQSSITRGRSIYARDGDREGITFSDADDLYLDGKRLLHVSGSHLRDGASYRTEVDDFSQITAGGSAPGSGVATYFKVETKDGRTLYYGNQNGQLEGGFHQLGGESQSLAYAYALTRVENSTGHYMTYTYSDWGGGEHLLESIQYTGRGSSGPLATIKFGYDKQTVTGDVIGDPMRDDTRYGYMVGRTKNSTARLDVVIAEMDGDETHRYDFGYEYAPATQLTRLVSVSTVARTSRTGDWESLSPTIFDWQDGAASFANATVNGPAVITPDPTDPLKMSRFTMAELNGDGIMDWVFFDWTGKSAGTMDYVVHAHLSNPLNGDTSWQKSVTLPDESPTNDYNGLDGVLFVKSGDVDGDGLADLVYSNGFSYWIMFSTGSDFSNPTKLFDNSDLNTLGAAPIDQDIIAPNQGYIDADANPRKTLSSHVDLGDFNGDGRADFLLHNSDAYVAMSNGSGFGNFNQWAELNDDFFLNYYYVVGPGGEALLGGAKAKLDSDLRGPAGWFTDFNGDGVQDYAYTLPEKPNANITGGLVDTRNLDATHVHNMNRNLHVLIADPKDNTFHHRTIPEVASGNEYKNFEFNLGESVAALTLLPLQGDFNGDGLTDLMCLVPRYVDAPETESGRRATGYAWRLLLSKGTVSEDNYPLTIGQWDYQVVEMSADVNGLDVEVLTATGQTVPTFAEAMWQGAFDAEFLPNLLNPGGDQVVIEAITDVSGASGVSAVDINQDGLTDLIWRAEVGVTGANSGSSLTTAQRGWWVALCRSDLGYVTFDPAYKLFDLGQGSLNGHHSVSLSDYDGDGIQDLSFGHRPRVTFEEELYADGHFIATRSGDNPDLLKKVTDGLGRQTEVSYSVLTESNIYVKGDGAVYPIRDMMDTRSVVSDVFHDYGADFDGGDKHQFSYTYAGARMDFSGRGDLGFQSFITLDHATGLHKYQFLAQSFPMTGLTVREETYRDKGSGSFDILSSHDNTVVFDKVMGSGGAYGSVYPFISEAIEYRWEDGAKSFTNTSSDQLYGIQDRSGAYVTIEANSRFDNQSSAQTTLPAGFFPSDTDSSGATHAHVVTGQEDVNYVSSLPGDITYGNLKRLHTDYGGGYTQTVTTVYAPPSSVSGFINLPESVTTEGVSPLGTETSPTTRYTYKSGTNLVKTIEIDAGGTQLDSTTEHKRDSHGRIEWTKVTSPGTGLQAVPDATTTYSDYDDVFDLPGKATNEYGHATTTTYHDWSAQPTSVTDTNGIETSTDYDALMRPVETRRKSELTDIKTTFSYSDSSGASVSYSRPGVSHSATSAYSMVATPDNQPATTTYFDRLARPIRVKRGTFSGHAYSDTVYDEFGRIIAVSNPSSSSTPSHWTETEYDDLGRVEKVTSPTGVVTTTAYDGLAQQVSVDPGSSGPANGANQVTTTLTNPKGETIKIWNANNVPSSFSQSALASSNSADLTFTLDGFGRMRTTTLKGQTETITATYDDLGNQITLNDPDKGDWDYLNNARGEVVEQIDANDNVTQSSFDALGRPLTRTTTEDATGIVETAKWYYYEQSGSGAPQSMPLGDSGWRGALQREEVSFSGAAWPYGNYDNAKSYTYDVDGRLALELHHIDGKWFYTSTDYNNTVNLPNKRYYYWRPRGSEDVFDPVPTNEWRTLGFTTAYNSESYVTSITSTAGDIWWQSGTYDHLDRPTVFTVGGHQTTRGYRPEDELLTSIDTSANIQNLDYLYDNLGNLTQRKDYTLTEDFTYDILNRLKTSEQGSYAYDDHGNITSKATIGGTITDYAYGTNAGPHAVTTANGLTHTYDDNGNLTGRDDGTSIAWMGFDKPRWMAKNGVGLGFHYNASRQRVVQHKFDSLPNVSSPTFTGKKLYVGSGMEVDYATIEGSLQLDRVRLYVNTPSGRSGAVEIDADNTANAEHRRLVYHQDHLGSIDEITEFVSELTALDWAEPTAREAEYSFDAWGERRDPIDWLGAPTTTTHGGADDLTPRGFTDHEMLDDLGLVHMNGRIYDPLLGRFLSADKYIQAPGNLQSYNRYSYVMNNPLTHTDPTGYYSVLGLEFTDGGGVGGFFSDLAGYTTDVASGVGEGGVDVAMSFRRSAEGIGEAAGYLSLDPTGTIAAAHDQLTTNLAEGVELLAETTVEDIGRDLANAGEMYVNNEDGFRDDVTDLATGSAIGLGTGTATQPVVSTIASNSRNLLGRLTQAAPDTRALPEVSPTQPAAVTNDTIRGAMAQSDVAPTQGAISKPVVERYVRRLEDGSEAPAIKVDEGSIVEGHHREVAGQIVNQPPAQTPSNLPSHKTPRKWDDVEIDEEDWGNN